jgi:hypothetical protein
VVVVKELCGVFGPVEVVVGIELDLCSSDDVITSELESLVESVVESVVKSIDESVDVVRVELDVLSREVINGIELGIGDDSVEVVM